MLEAKMEMIRILTMEISLVWEESTKFSKLALSSDDPTDTEGDDDEDGSGTEDDTEQSGNETEEDAEKDDEPDPKKIKLAYTNKKVNNKIERKHKSSTFQLNLNARDKSGRNLVHYFVWPNAWENVELLNNFYKMEPTALKSCITAKDLVGG